jgi:O-antigen/teichoic acid export membrane protein
VKLPLRPRELQRHAADPLLRNSFILALNVILGAGAGFLYWTIAARSYGPSEVGAAGAVTALLPLVTTCASLGLAEMLVRHYARNHNQAHMLLRSGTTVISVAGLLATIWWAIAGDRSPLNEIATGLGSYGLLLIAVIATAAGLLTTATMIASRRPALILTETAVGAVTRIGTMVLLRDHGAAGILASFAAGATATTLTGSVMVLKVLKPRRSNLPSMDRDHHSFALVNWISAMVSLTPRAVATTLIVWRAGTEAAAWVAIPLMTLPLLTIVPSVLGRSLFAEASNNPSELGRMLKKAIVTAVALTSIGMLVVLAGAPLLLELFGDNYARESSTLLRLLAVAAVIAAPNYMLDVALNVSGHRGGFLATNVTGTVAFLALITLLSSAGPAGIGAAWVAGQSAYLTVAVVAWKICSRRPKGRVAEELPGEPETQALP